MPGRAILLFALGVALFGCGPDWREYRSTTGKFVVRFPGDNVVAREVKQGDGVVSLVSVTVDDTTAYGVGWYDIAEPPKPAAEILKDAQAKMLRDLNAGLTAASEIRYGDRADGPPGRAFTARAASGVDVAVRFYAVGTKPMRVYQLIAAVPDAARAEHDLRRFFGSFKLID
jgi:hypothetical protein